MKQSVKNLTTLLVFLKILIDILLTEIRIKTRTLITTFYELENNSILIFSKKTDKLVRIEY